MKTLALIALSSALSFAQSKPAGSGHWEGTITPPGMSAAMSVDLARTEKGEWIGDLDIPDRNMKDVPLSGITVEGGKVSFALAGSLTFSADLAPDGKSMKGEAAAGMGAVPFELKWVAEPKVVLPVKSPAVGKEFEGLWNGTLNTPDGNALRIQLKLANEADFVKGTVVSIDQGNTELSTDNVKQDGKKLSFEVKTVGVQWTGELNAAGTEMAGNLTQGNFAAPLNFKKEK